MFIVRRKSGKANCKEWLLHRVVLLNMFAKLRARYRLKYFIVLGQDPKVEPDRRNIVSDEIGWLMILYKTDVITYQEILQETLVELDSLYGRYSPRLERNMTGLKWFLMINPFFHWSSLLLFPQPIAKIIIRSILSKIQST